MRLLQEPFTAEYLSATLAQAGAEIAEGNISILKSLKKSCLGVLRDLCGEEWFAAEYCLSSAVNIW